MDSKTSKSNLPVLGYWNIRGNAQPIRLLLSYTLTDYHEKSYNFRKVYDLEHPDWSGDKYNLGLDFPNLPYYIDGQLKLTQSLAILRHLARKHNLAGHDESERIRIEIVEQELRMCRNRFIDATVDKNFQAAQDAYYRQLPTMIKSLSDFLGVRPYFAGNSISYADFMAYEFIDQHYYLTPALIKQYGSNLIEFLHRIEELPTISEYQQSDRYIRWPSGLLIPWYESQFYSTFNRSVSDKHSQHMLIDQFTGFLATEQRLPEKKPEGTE